MLALQPITAAAALWYLFLLITELHFFSLKTLDDEASIDKNVGHRDLTASGCWRIKYGPSHHQRRVSVKLVCGTGELQDQGLVPT